MAPSLVDSLYQATFSPLRSVLTLRDRLSRNNVFPLLSALALRDCSSRDTIGYHGTLLTLVLLVLSTTCTVYSP